MLEAALPLQTPTAIYAGIPMEVTIAERGQIVIPKAARDELGLRAGMKLNVWLQDNQLVMKKRVKLNLEKWMGIAPDDGLTAQELLDEIRGR